MSSNQVPPQRLPNRPPELSAGRLTDTVPVGLRWARKPDGRDMLQAAYRWRQGDLSGVEWRDVPFVEVTE